MKIAHAVAFCGLVCASGQLGQAVAQNATDNRIERALQGLRPPIAIKGRPAMRWSIAERMATHQVPGAGIAIIDDGRVVWAGGFGVKEAQTTEAVTPSTLFQAQSISKPVSATAALVLADAGRLSLDEDVNTYLKSWIAEWPRH